MRRGLMALVLAAAVGMPSMALACSSHGSAAGNQIQAWINGNGDENAGVNANGFTVTGSQSVQHDANGNLVNANGWNANSWYQVTVTFPGTPTHSVTITANPVNFPGGAELEAWLEAEAKKVIINAAPPDVANADFVG